ncbi:YgiT-type zinc finger protein [Cyanobacterium sp. Dongsha4]|uniref:YgiT-type zinc finger protein n=1 Tax=Cyanobacterium sp. DS4 TaxID=2878255 RepID=UPI002E818050|nr:YgiT-type zinc finger protein [Cyanobacterium sp. Dongsha4]WVL00025.1 YgiT-type zinc finger protein [Cyanobacterium sp. Dongsha4]
MNKPYPQETFTNALVTYTLELEGKIYIFENVPARICQETGERLFSPETVEKIQQIIWDNKPPQKYI